MKNSQIPIVIILSLLFNLSCRNKSEYIISDSKSIVYGTIPQSASKANVVSISFIGNDFGNAYLSEITDSSGNFRFEISISIPHVAYLYTHSGILPIYISPDDSLSIILNHNDLMDGLKLPFSFTGNNASTTRNIQEYIRYYDPNSFYPEPDNKSVEQYLTSLKRNMDQEDSLLNSFIDRNRTSQQFETWARHDIIYRNANFIEDYKFYHYANKSTFTGDLFNKNLFPIEYKNPLTSVSYYTYLWNYSMFKYIEKDSVVSNLFKKGLISESYKTCLKKIFENETSGLSRDLMIYALTTDVVNKSKDEFIKICPDALKYINNKSLRSKLIDKKIQVEKETDFHISQLDGLTFQEKEISGDFFSTLISKYPGKVIYVDLWATWCGPCRKEFLHTPEIHEYFEDKSVVFVNLCLSSDKSEWINTVKNLKVKGENYYFNKAQTEILRTKLKYKGLPTYLVIDKNGNLISQSAPRPSEKETLTRLLNGLIKD